MKRIIIMALFVFPILVNAQTPDYNLIVGTYTTGKSEGIYVYRFNTSNGAFSLSDKAVGIKNPSYLTPSFNNKFIYAVSEMPEEKGGVGAYKFDRKLGKIAFVNSEVLGNSLCYISTDKAAKSIFVASYGGGSLAVLPINKDGSIAPVSQTIEHLGKSVDIKRQTKPYVHSTVLSPDEKYLFVCDLGTDELNVYNYNSELKQPLTTVDTVRVKPGNGPRHLEFHPNGKFAYLIQEVASAVNTYRYLDGKLTELQSISMLPEGFEGNAGAAAIHISPDGKFLYASNRLDLSEIVIYKINQKTGLLTWVGKQSSLGKNPRDFTIDPTGKYLLAANQNSDSIVVFERNKVTGLLKDTGKRIEVGNPVCLKWVKVN